MEIPQQLTDKLLALLNEIEDETGQEYKLILSNKNFNKEIVISNEAIEVSNSVAVLNGIHKSIFQLVEKAKKLDIDLSYSNGKLYMEDNDGYEHEYGSYVYI